jgi:acetyl-CoA carboxylase biotin carboxyl carrier protein
MLNKKINQTIDDLIKKIKDNNLGSIKLSDKSNTIEISNNYKSHCTNPNITSAPLTNNQNSINETIDSFISIDSPMVGIIYLTPKPSSPPFAKKGQRIKKGDTICLIEAMKTFNEIKSDRDCTIKTVMVKNGEAVEFGQPLFEIS